MITINLLPKELRSGGRAFAPRKEFFILIGGVSGFSLLVFLLLILALAGGQELAMNRMTKELEKLAPVTQEVRKIKSDIRLLQEQTAALGGLKTRGLLWSKKMNQISDLLGAGIWLVALDLNEKRLTTPDGKKEIIERSLVVKGRVYSREKDEPAVVGRYINALKNDQDFFKDFQNIQLENIQSLMLGQTSVSEFILICPLKKEGA